VKRLSIDVLCVLTMTILMMQRQLISNTITVFSAKLILLLELPTRTSRFKLSRILTTISPTQAETAMNPAALLLTVLSQTMTALLANNVSDSPILILNQQ